MTKVFLSGSRSIRRLDEAIRQRLEKIVAQSFEVLVGDANGADKAFQSWLRDRRYERVTVYCSGGRCRNNVGAWPAREIEVPPRLKGRDFYTVKDRAMADEADYGLVLWDGDSVGSIENVVALLRRGKKTLVYLAAEGAFHSVATAAQLDALLARIPRETLEAIRRKADLETVPHDIPSEQPELLGI